MSSSTGSQVRGKVGFITGASAGIGEAVAYKFAKMGIDLFLTARRADRLKALADRLVKEFNVSIKYAELDVRDRSQVDIVAKEAINSLGVPDYLINNAGLCRGFDPIQSGSIDDWEVMIDTNIKGLLYVTKAFIGDMIKRGDGHIVNLGSIAGEEVYPCGNVYNATKFAVKALSKSLNIDLVGTNIKVTNIAPGMVDTEFSTVRFGGDKQRADNMYKGLTPLYAADIADAIAYVVSTPPSVNIQYMLVMPTAQRTIGVVHRD